MAVDVDKRVQTTFTVVDRATANVRKLSQLMARLGKQTTQTRHALKTFGSAQARVARSNVAAARSTSRIAGATQRATRAQRHFRMSLRDVRFSLIGVTAAAAGFFAVMQTRKIVKLSDDFEQTRLAIAGTLKALGFAKEFDKAMDISAAAMEKIRIQAALLPGEADEYVEVFRAGLAGMRGAIKGTLNDMIKFSGHYTALAKTMKVDAPQAGRDLRLMLQAGAGMAGSRVKMFQALLPTIQELPKHVNLTAKSFNAMTQEARGSILQQALAAHVDQINAAKDTWDAQAGAIKSNIDLIRRLGGAELFEGMKAGMKFMNDRLMDAEGNMTALMKSIIGVGEAISKGIVAGMQAAARAAKTLYDWTNKAIGAAKAMSGGNGGGSALGAAAGAGAMVMGAAGPMGAAIAGLVEFSTRTEAVAEVLAKLSQFGEMLITPFSALANAAMAVSGMIADVLEGALGGFISMITDVVGPVLGFFAEVVNMGVAQFKLLQPTLMNLWKSVGILFTGIGKFLNPIIRIVATSLLAFYKLTAFFIVPIFDVLVTVVSAVTTVLGLLLEAIGGWLGNIADFIDDPLGAKAATGVTPLEKKNEQRDFIAEFFAKFKYTASTPENQDELLNVGAKQLPGARGGGGRAYQDFRYSRFTIDQKFEEGFDPDRIAVALASDLGKIGETKLQSGFEPLFSLA